MIQYGREKMLACAASVKESTIGRSERMPARLGYRDVDDGLAGLARRTRERSYRLPRKKERADGAQPSALPQVI